MHFQKAVAAKAFVFAVTISSPLIVSSAFAEDTGSGSCKTDDGTKKLADQAKSAGSQLPGFDTSDWGSAEDDCKGKNKDAQTSCFEACSKPAQDGYKAAADTASKIQPGQQNVTDQLGSSAASQAIAGLTGYKAQCAGGQSGCNGACDKALQKAKEAAQKAQEAAQKCDEKKKAACMAAAAAVKGIAGQEEGKGHDVAGGKKKQCTDDFNKKQADAAQMMKSIADMLKALADAAKKDSDPGAAPADTSNVPCAQLPAGDPRLSTKECICSVSDPNNPACDGVKMNEAAGFGAGTKDSGAVVEGAPSSLAQSSPSPSMAAGSSAAGGGPGGMMAGGGASGAGPAAAKAENAEKAKSGINANILGSDGPGGGGGAWSSYNGGDKDETTKAGKHSAGVARGISGQYTSSVSGPGGRTNWDKVKVRYSENRPTFLKDL